MQSHRISTRKVEAERGRKGKVELEAGVCP